MTDWYVGQKVVCVTDITPARLVTHIPKRWRVYTIRGVRLVLGDVGLLLEEVVNSPRQWIDGFLETCWFEGYFRPVVSQYPDISIFTEILDRLNERSVEHV